MDRPLANCHNSCFAKPGSQEIFTFFGPENSQQVGKHYSKVLRGPMADKKNNHISWLQLGGICRLQWDGKIEMNEKTEKPLAKWKSSCVHKKEWWAAVERKPPYHGIKPSASHKLCTSTCQFLASLLMSSSHYASAYAPHGSCPTVPSHRVTCAQPAHSLSPNSNAASSILVRQLQITLVLHLSGHFPSFSSLAAGGSMVYHDLL